MELGYPSYELIKFGEARNGIDERKLDIYQFLITQFITNNYFPWLMLTLLLNKNWKRPVIIIITLLWFLKSVSYISDRIKVFFRSDIELIWPYSYERWRYSMVPHYILMLISEIIGDWYPLMRTKSVTNNGWKKIFYVYLSCILFNSSKLYGIFIYIYYYNIDLTAFDENGNSELTMMEHKVSWWRCVVFIQITSLLYDISVIYSLKTCLFDKLKEFKGKNNLLDKFKYISELRIVLSMVASIIFIPFAFLVALLLERILEGKVGLHQNENPETRVEELRNVVITINYTFIYIDQILLKIYASNYKNENDDNSEDDDNENGDNITYTTTDPKNFYYNNNNNRHEMNSRMNSKVSNMSNTSYFKKLNFIQNALADYEGHSKSLITINPYQNQNQNNQKRQQQELQQEQQQIIISEPSDYNSPDTIFNSNINSDTQPMIEINNTNLYNPIVTKSPIQNNQIFSYN